MATTKQGLVSEDGSATAHFVRFYQDDVVLLTEAADFLDRGLRSGGTAIIIATPDHLASLRQQLMGLGALNGERGWFPGKLVMLDAADALAQFMVNDWPDEQRFDDAIGSVMRDACMEGKTVHAFGEMVALLCDQGLYDAAVRLEQLWNDLREKCRFSLFCAYPWKLFPTEALASAFQRICGEHDHVCMQTPELHPAQQDLSVQLAILEQQNIALRTEVARARESELTLRQRERELADFVENAAEGLHRVAPDGTILWANKAELALLGYHWEEYVGHHIAEFHIDQEVIAEILERLQAGETLYDQPARMRCRDGAIKHVVVNSNAYLDNGKLRYTRCFTRDATERHLLEQANLAREALLKELTRSNHAKDEFLAMLAHELRNPLAPVSAAAQLLRIAADNPDRVRHAAAIIARQVGHMTSLIDDLLDVARVTRGLIVLNKATLDFRGLVSEAAEQAVPEIHSRGQRLTLNLPSHAAAIDGDRKRIVQVIANILGNAAKFSPEGAEIRVRLLVVGEQVELHVIDQGNGMDADLVTRVFDLFIQGRRTLDRSQGGLGIGLALAKSLVESHGGSIHARSDGPGKGSTFTVRLPRSGAEPTAPVPLSQGSGLQRVEEPLRILVVDDNRDAADSLTQLLATTGHEARAIYTAVAAVTAAESGWPQVFLLDIGLPEIDGIRLAGQLRAIPAASKAVLIAVTGYGQERDKARTREAGFHYHLVKPINTDELLTLLARAAAQDDKDQVDGSATDAD